MTTKENGSSKRPPKVIVVLVVIIPGLALAALSYMMLRGIDSLPMLEQDRSILSDVKLMARGAAILGGLSGLSLGLGAFAVARPFGIRSIRHELLVLVGQLDDWL